MHNDRATSDAGTRFLWLLRHYAGLVLVLLALAVGASVAVDQLEGDQTAAYEANALVVTKRLQGRVDPRIVAEQLPRLAAAVFDSGSVARRAVLEGGLPFEPTELIPLHAELEPIEGTIAVRVKSRAAEPDLAKRIADSVAAALAAELTQKGTGIGQFQAATADEAVRAEAGRGAKRLLLAGVVGGLLLALAVVTGIGLVRNPATTPREAEIAAGGPLLAVLTLPRRGKASDPVAVPGLAGLAHSIFQRGDVVAFVACRGAGRARTTVAQLMARYLARTRDTVLVTNAASESLDAGLSIENDITVVDLAAGSPVVIDVAASEGLDVPQLVPPSAVCALVVREGTPTRHIREMSSLFLSGQLAGLVFVRRARASRRKSVPTPFLSDAPSGQSGPDLQSVRGATATISPRERS